MKLQWFASRYAGAQDMFFIGRGIDYATSMEGSVLQLLRAAMWINREIVRRV